MIQNNNNIEEKYGTVVSIDVTNSTKLSLEQKASAWNKNINCLVDIIDTVLNGTSGEVVRYTGDGALLFFQDSTGAISCDEAVRFSIDLCNSWKRYRSYLKDVFIGVDKLEIRIVLDWGKVITHLDGGLWSGNSLNIASKIRGCNDRVVITEVVKEKMKNYLYKELFSNVIETAFPNIKALSIKINHKDDNCDPKGLLDSNIRIIKKNAKIAICVIGTGSKWYQLEAVLTSLFLQSYKNFQVIVILKEKSEIDVEIEKSYFYKYIDIIKVSEEGAKNRAYARNTVLSKLLNSVETVCFLDGDTVMGPKCMKIAYNLIESQSDIVFAPPRLDVDTIVNENDALILTNLLQDKRALETVEILGMNASYRSFKIIKKERKESKSVSTEQYYALNFLPSYALFVPVSIINSNGKWDENFENWGEEDIDYTYRIHLNGYRLCMPILPHFVVQHLTHDLSDGTLYTYARNAQYLLSKFPELKPFRSIQYAVIGMPGFKHY